MNQTCGHLVLAGVGGSRVCSGDGHTGAGCAQILCRPLCDAGRRAQQEEPPAALASETRQRRHDVYARHTLHDLPSAQATGPDNADTVRHHQIGGVDHAAQLRVGASSHHHLWIQRDDLARAPLPTPRLRRSRRGDPPGDHRQGLGHADHINAYAQHPQGLPGRGSSMRADISMKQVGCDGMAPFEGGTEPCRGRCARTGRSGARNIA